MMDTLNSLIELFLNLDEHLDESIQNYGVWTYAFLFLVIFLETGLVVAPFLPSDTLLFVAGSSAARGSFNVLLLLVLLFIAAILGDACNYWIGRTVGPPIFDKNYRFLKREHLEKTQKFYDEYGGKTIVMARFVPILRTFAPFVAGVGTMEYRRFTFYNIFGAFIWISIIIFGGYFFGSIPIIKTNFEVFLLGLIFISALAMVLAYFRGRKSKRH
jgi:membrane-associated protein